MVGVDSGDHPDSSASSRDTRSYTLANPQFAALPVLSSASGSANIETFVTAKPQVIFMMGSATNMTGETTSPADALEERTGIPVIAIPQGSYTTPEGRAELYSSYRIIGKALGRQDRAEKLSQYIETTITDLERRTQDIPESEQKTAYIGGLSYGGSHGLMSTQTSYPPFLWTHVKNIANGTVTQTTTYSKESLIYADPDFIFIDAGTLGVTSEIGGFEDIRSPVFAELKAVKSGNVYATLPYNYRSSNLDTILADAYFVGKTVYPERFSDINPEKKADEIYSMFVNKPVFREINANCNNLGFTRFSGSGS
ncbi:MAG: ABC transporter substrate-binding protein [Methanomicrobiales archaeon]|nr:ABC transporter substrate-binding protein [Methanomicrobiales archaeon]